MLSPGPKKEWPPPPGGTVEVGDGRTSLNLVGASFRSAFQNPVPQGKLFGPRPIADEAECDPQGPAVLSADGVVGCEAVGDIEVLANEPFRGRARGCEVSLSQDERLTGFGCGAYANSGRWSASSSELARASESGVDVLAFTFSSSRVWLLATVA